MEGNSIWREIELLVLQPKERGWIYGLLPRCSNALKDTDIMVQEADGGCSGRLTRRLSSVSSTATPASTLPTVKETSMVGLLGIGGVFVIILLIAGGQLDLELSQATAEAAIGLRRERELMAVPPGDPNTLRTSNICRHDMPLLVNMIQLIHDSIYRQSTARIFHAVPCSKPQTACFKPPMP